MVNEIEIERDKSKGREGEREKCINEEEERGGERACVCCVIFDTLNKLSTWVGRCQRVPQPR